jgi:hypothetical protein
MITTDFETFAQRSKEIAWTKTPSQKIDGDGVSSQWEGEHVRFEEPKSWDCENGGKKSVEWLDEKTIEELEEMDSDEFEFATDTEEEDYPVSDDDEEWQDDPDTYGRRRWEAGKRMTLYEVTESKDIDGNRTHFLFHIST